MVKNLVMNLDLSIFDISVVSMFNEVNDKYKKFIELYSGKIHFYFLDKKKGRVSLIFFFRLQKTLKSINPDVLSTHTGALFYTALANLFQKKPLIHTIHSLPSLDQKTYVRKMISRSVKKGKIILIGCSKTIALMAEKIYKTKVNYINNGVQTNDFKPEDKTYDFVTIGRLVKMKRVDVIIRSFAIFDQNSGRHHLAIIGDGPEKPYLEKIVNENKIKNVHFLGEQSDVQQLLKKASVHVMASEWEGNPMSILEAMTCGVPTIAPRVGGIPDILTNERNGFLFEKDDVARLPFLMEKILNPTTLSKLSKECKLDSAKYDIRTTANDYGILFRKYGENR